LPRRPAPIDDRGLEALVQTVVRLREEREWSVNDLARESDIAPATLVSLEDRTNEPRWGTLRRIARALDTELEDLLGRAEHLEREMKQKERAP
jgi:transcriptional regulator with XRE-family HTH domain